MQFLIETDILNDYLIHRSSQGESSVLRRALAQATCYTTMINAMELFASASDQKSRDATMNLLMVVRVLGFSARYAEPFATLGKEIEQEKKMILTQRELMILAMAKTSKLTVVTRKYFDRYHAANVVTVVRDPAEVPVVQE